MKKVLPPPPSYLNINSHKTLNNKEFNLIKGFENRESFKYIEKLRVYVEEIKQISPADSYTLILHKHLGDVFYTIGTKDEFRRKFGEDLFFIVRPQQEFLMKLWGVTRYATYDLDSIVKNNKDFIRYFFDGRIPSAEEKDWLIDSVFQELFPAVPLKGMPFICDNRLNLFVRYPKYWCYRWAESLTLSSDFKFSLPPNKLPLSKAASTFCQKFGGVDRIVLFSPEAQTAAELPVEFWEIIAKEVRKAGYTVVVNSKRYPLTGTVSLFDYPLTLEDVISIGQNCAYVFSLRSGLCDVLVGRGNRLYALSPAQLRREDGSLTIPFTPDTECNEVQIYDWTVPEFQWQGIDLRSALQPSIDLLHRKYLLSSVKKILCPTKKHRAVKNFFRNIAGKSHRFPENNVLNPIPDVSKKIHFGSTAFEWYSKKTFDRLGIARIEKKLFGGLIKVKKSPVERKFYIAGIPLLATKHRKKKVTKVLGIPVWFKDRRKSFFDYLKGKIAPGFDHIYISRHNIGETVVYLSHLKSWIEKNKSKKPLVVVWREKDLPFYKMFLGNEVAIQFLPIAQSDLNSFFREEVTEVNGVRFYVPTFRIAESMKVAHKENREVNFNNFILKSMGLPSDSMPSNKVVIADEVKAQVAEQLRAWKIDQPFVLLCPLATSLKDLPDEFWVKLCEDLRDKGYLVLVNTPTEIQGLKADVFCYLPIDQLYELASRAKAIYTLASGLGVLLSYIGVPITLLYTDFRSRSIGYSSKLAMEIYSVKHQNLVEKSYIFEIDANSEGALDIKKLTQMLSNRPISAGE